MDLLAKITNPIREYEKRKIPKQIIIGKLFQIISEYKGNDYLICLLEYIKYLNYQLLLKKNNKNYPNI